MDQNDTQVATILSTDQFLRRVADAEPRTAVFDFDGTLWPGDAGSGFMRHSIDTGLLSADSARWVADRHASYHRGEVDEITICGEMVQVYRGLSEAAVRSAVHQYFTQHVQPHFYPVMLQLVHRLQSTGVDVWAVSSTNNWMIEAGVRALGIPSHKVLAACVHSLDGIITGDLIAVPSDEGKAEALRRAGLAQPDIVFGNSVHDAAMLEMARVAFPVNPSPQLQQLSAQRNWPVYFPATAAPTHTAGSTLGQR